MSAETNDRTDGAIRAPQACSSCRKQKRKCDKCLPTCSLCLRMGRICDYTEVEQPLSIEEFQSLRQKVLDLENRLQSSNGSLLTPPSSSNDSLNGTGLGASQMRRGPRVFPAMFFLDAQFFCYGKWPVPKASMSVPTEALDLLGSAADVQLAVGTFFETVHKYFPIISKKRLQLHLFHPSAEPGADVALLFLCMKLAIERPHFGADDGGSLLYTVAKEFYVKAEAGRLMTLSLLQAGLLIALYEVGHAVYPAAFLSVGNCARLAYALGLRNSKDRPQMLPMYSTHTEREERRRVWWGVVILDRFVALGGSMHPLVAEDPKPDEELPVDDDDWDEGRMGGNELVFISSPIGAPAAPFARLCQAATFLGRVLRFESETVDDSELRLRGALQLEKEIKPFSAALVGNGFDEDYRLRAATAVSYSTLHFLYENYACIERYQTVTAHDWTLQKTSINGLDTVSQEVTWFSQQLSSSFDYTTDTASPFAADCLYQAAATFAWRLRESGDPAFEELLRSVESTLIKLDQRWAVAGEYKRILDTTESSMEAGKPLEFYQNS